MVTVPFFTDRFDDQSQVIKESFIELFEGALKRVS